MGYLTYECTPLKRVRKARITAGFGEERVANVATAPEELRFGHTINTSATSDTNHSRGREAGI
jgi:hypothetical protein